MGECSYYVHLKPEYVRNPMEDKSSSSSSSSSSSVTTTAPVVRYDTSTMLPWASECSLPPDSCRAWKKIEKELTDLEYQVTKPSIVTFNSCGETKDLWFQLSLPDRCIPMCDSVTSDTSVKADTSFPHASEVYREIKDKKHRDKVEQVETHRLNQLHFEQILRDKIRVAIDQMRTSGKFQLDVQLNATYTRMYAHDRCHIYHTFEMLPWTSYSAHDACLAWNKVSEELTDLGYRLTQGYTIGFHCDHSRNDLFFQLTLPNPTDVSKIKTEINTSTLGSTPSSHRDRLHTLAWPAVPFLLVGSITGLFYWASKPSSPTPSGATRAIVTTQTPPSTRYPCLTPSDDKSIGLIKLNDLFKSK